MSLIQFFQKYKAKRTVRSGYSFASGLEADLYTYLKLLEKGGEVQEIQCQPNVYLTEARIQMIPDFTAMTIDKEGNSRRIYYEAKGFETDVWRIKRKLWTVYGPAPLHVYKRGTKKGLLRLTETIIPHYFKIGQSGGSSDNS